MARVKRAVNAHKKRRAILESASGYRGQRSRLYRKAKEQMLRSMQYAYRDRKDRKGDFRRLWIMRINAGARANGMTYNRFIQGLRLAGWTWTARSWRTWRSTTPHFSALAATARKAVAGPAPPTARPGRRAPPEAPCRHASGAGSAAAHPAADPAPTLFTRRTPRVVAAARLHRRKERDARQRFLVEGPQAVREALAGAGVVEQVFVTPAGQARHAALLAAAARAGVPVSPVTETRWRPGGTVTAGGGGGVPLTRRWRTHWRSGRRW